MGLNPTYRGYKDPAYDDDIKATRVLVKRKPIGETLLQNLTVAGGSEHVVSDSEQTYIDISTESKIALQVKTTGVAAGNAIIKIKGYINGWDTQPFAELTIDIVAGDAIQTFLIDVEGLAQIGVLSIANNTSGDVTVDWVVVG